MQHAVRCHDLHVRQLIAGETVSSGEHADPTAQCQPGDSHGGAGATWQKEVVRCQGAVDVNQLVAGSHCHECLVRARRPADGDGIHARDVDDQAGARRVAAVAVPARTGRHLHVVLAGEGETTLHVADGSTLGDGRGVGGVEGVVQVPGRGISAVARLEQRADQRRGKL